MNWQLKPLNFRIPIFNQSYRVIEFNKGLLIRKEVEQIINLSE
jgi:hypothetical protein